MKFQIIIDNDDDHEDRKYHKHRRFPVIYGNFYDENGPYLREHGLKNLSVNFFCRTDALTFIQEALAAGQITKEEAHLLEKDSALLSLPEKCSFDYALYQQRVKDREEKMVTAEGLRQLDLIPEAESKYSIKRLLVWLSRYWWLLRNTRYM